jgi:choline dehydrogenase
MSKRQEITRRQFVTQTAGGIAAAMAMGPMGAARALGATIDGSSSIEYYDYIVIGSGAGGGTVACRLAQRPRPDGRPTRVLILEAGSKGASDRKIFPIFPDDLPVAHAWASEDPALAWSFYVKHYRDKNDPMKNRLCPYDDKDNSLYDANTLGKRYRDGILYPRGSTVGGCTAVNALITLYPDGRDWDKIGKENGGTADRFWNAKTMYDTYFRRFDAAMAWSKGGPDCRVPAIAEVREWAQPWFHNEGANPWIALLDHDTVLMRILTATLYGVYHGDPNIKRDFEAFKQRHTFATYKAAMAQIERHPLKAQQEFRAEVMSFFNRLDPNVCDYVANMTDGIVNIPKATLGGHRWGTRNFIDETMKTHKNLKLKDQAFVTRLLLDDAPGARRGRDSRWTAIGVEYVRGENFYEAAHSSIPASSRSNPEMARRHQARLLPGGEVIMAGGTFNTPQLLMLSGIGSKKDVEDLGLYNKVNLPGVGTNLQDRYEVTIITKLDKPLGILEKCEMGRENDACIKTWRDDPAFSPYSTNGVLAAQAFTSSTRKSAGLSPDMIIFGLSGKFPGYTTDYSKTVTGSYADGKKHDDGKYLTWAVLKGHTDNNAGYVKVKHKEWWKAPEVNFVSFEEGWDERKNFYGEGKNLKWWDDVEALREGVEQIRNNLRDPIRLGDPLKNDRQAKGWEETLPEPREGGKPHDADSLREFIRKRAWGHHACGTCPMGPKEDPMAVVDSNFKVHGVNDLRIVDASTWRRIPGLFIVVPTYLIAEKAAATITGDEGPEGTNA